MLNFLRVRVPETEEEMERDLPSAGSLQLAASLGMGQEQTSFIRVFNGGGRVPSPCNIFC